MNIWLVQWWDAFRTSFWFVPTMLGGFALLLAFIMPEVDRIVAGGEAWPSWTVTSAPAALASFASIAGAMITVTGVVFSITMVALTNTASLYGSRLLRKWMEDGLTHFALGSLGATSLYCLIVLRVVREGKEMFVPHLSVALGIVFAIVSMGIFVVFIHNVAVRLQAPNLVGSVATELIQTIDRLYPERLGSEPVEPPQPEENAKVLGDSFEKVTAQMLGYLQGIDTDRLMWLASEREVVLYIPSRPGAFLSETSVLAQVWPKEKLDDSLAADLRGCFIVGNSRTPRQDLEFAIHELVEIGVRALSPGINDPFTAMTCLDYLGAALTKLASRTIPSPVRKDERGIVRVITHTITFRLATERAFRMIRHYGQANAGIVEGVLCAIEAITPHVVRQDDTALLRDEVMTIRKIAQQLAEERDQMRCVEFADRLLHELTR